MLQNLISLQDGMWVLDPQKISDCGLYSFAVADRMGSDEIEAILKAAELSDQGCQCCSQDGGELTCLEHSKVDQNFFQHIGEEYYKNQFLAISTRLVVWLPDFSEYSVVVLSKDLYPNLKSLIKDFSQSFEEWVTNEFWTDGERSFVKSGYERYSIMPPVA